MCAIIATSKTIGQEGKKMDKPFVEDGKEVSEEQWVKDLEQALIASGVKAVPGDPNANNQSPYTFV